jgi:hypothetical protein
MKNTRYYLPLAIGFITLLPCCNSFEICNRIYIGNIDPIETHPIVVSAVALDSFVNAAIEYEVRGIEIFSNDNMAKLNLDISTEFQGERNLHLVLDLKSMKLISMEIASWGSAGPKHLLFYEIDYSNIVIDTTSKEKVNLAFSVFAHHGELSAGRTVHLFGNILNN